MTFTSLTGISIDTIYTACDCNTYASQLLYDGITQ